MSPLRIVLLMIYLCPIKFKRTVVCACAHFHSVILKMNLWILDFHHNKMVDGNKCIWQLYRLKRLLERNIWYCVTNGECWCWCPIRSICWQFSFSRSIYNRMVHFGRYERLNNCINATYTWQFIMYVILFLRSCGFSKNACSLVNVVCGKYKGAHIIDRHIIDRIIAF